MLRAAIEGIKKRGKSDVGDKTLLDALSPAIDELRARLRGRRTGADALPSSRGRRPGEHGRSDHRDVAKRGRASYTGRARASGRSTPEPIAVAVMFERVASRRGPVDRIPEGEQR